MIIVNLMSQDEGEIKRFLNMFYNKDTKTDSDVMEWIYVYKKPELATKIIKMFMKKKEKYNISLWVQLDNEDLTPVKSKNYKKVLDKIEEKIVA